MLGAENDPVNRLFQKHGATLVGQTSVQSVWSNYYRKPLEDADAVAVDAGSIAS